MSLRGQSKPRLNATSRGEGTVPLDGVKYWRRLHSAVAVLRRLASLRLVGSPPVGPANSRCVDIGK